MYHIAKHGGVPTLFRDNEPFPAAAYMTYLPERGRYEDFAAAGYELFSLPVFFAGKAISATAGVRPFGPGLFDGETPDYSAFDANVRAILAVSPEARILPRVNVSLPDRWLKAHPKHLDATGEHESLCAETAAEAAAALLRQFIAHVQTSDYADRVIGWHLAGGCTEEWFHFDMNCPSICSAAERGYRRYLKETHPAQADIPLPDLAAPPPPGAIHGFGPLALYLEYLSAAAASYIERLARAAKEATGGKAPVGVFYGYTLEVTSPRYGTHALGRLLANPDIDFICSPCSYIGVRDPDADWTEMFPAASARLHGKFCLQECDVRTHKTVPLSKCAPAYDPAGALNAPVWHGLPDREAALRQLRKVFCRQLICGNGFWWFDMWGGWYHDEAVMAEMAAFRRICAAALQKDRAGVCELAVFTDERIYRTLTDCALRSAAHTQRRALGLIGAPYDCYDIADFPAVCDRYKACVFLAGTGSEALKNAVARCEKTGTPYLCNSEEQPEFPVKTLRALCERAGVHLYCEAGDIVYANKSYIALYALESGEKTLRFRTEVSLKPLIGGKGVHRGKTVRFYLEKHETALFEIT